MTLTAYAAEAPSEPKTAEPKAAAPVPSAPAVELESTKEWKDLQAQEQWVARLKKQLAGESNQLSEMRTALADKYKLDAKKLEAGKYAYDEKTGAFSEKK